MRNSKYYSLALEALAELAPELADATNRATPPPQTQPNFDAVTRGVGNLPAGALFLGMADDGLPVLLDLFDGSPGPLLIVGDERAGKTLLLKTLARTAAEIYAPHEIQIGIVSSDKTDWTELESLPHCAEVNAFSENDSQELVAALYDWAHQDARAGLAVLFLVDGFDCIGQWDEATRTHLRWLLLRGPSRRIWPILTLNAARIGDVKEWLSLFRTFIYGRVSNDSFGDMLTGASNAGLESLRAGVEFTMREGNHWLRFQIPSLR
ncbi:MAG: hypothetical protein HFACDABA_01436 [Anaerolineales bacterium]|nr:hypothetical protein [Anaerolineales bacterium]